MSDDIARSLAHAKPVPYWWDDPERPETLPGLMHDVHADLLVVGGGYAGLWTALLAKERDPGREVVVIESHSCGHAASGRNGGFTEASLTHGFENGLARWPDDLPALLRMGRDNLHALGETVERYGIDCNFELNGSLTVATEDYQVEGLRESATAMTEFGLKTELLDATEARRRVASPTVKAAIYDPEAALVEPARLAWGLREACRGIGVTVYEGTKALAIEDRGADVEVTTERAQIRAGQVVLATNAYRPLLRRLRLMTVPVHDYALVTEPLTQAQRDAVRWHGREGIGDSGNQFHYVRQTRDHRILFGGYDAIYHYASATGPAYDQRPATSRLLAEHFFTMFPMLEGLSFSHQWGGMIDTSTQFSAFYGRAMRGKVTYALGFTGLGVAATRFAALVMLDLLAGRTTERTQLEMVRKRPLPFPPEPVRFAGIQATRWSLARADAREGHENLWLKLTDRLGLGFDS